MKQGIKHNIKKNSDCYSRVSTAAVQLQRNDSGNSCDIQLKVHLAK
jgi:hypothetical protein